MKIALFSSCLLIVMACTTAKESTTTKNFSEKNKDLRYGYSASNPIKVGGVTDAPVRERDYLYSLSGPSGEKIWFSRQGSCCAFKTENSPFGDNGLLDKYSVTYEGKGDTVTLYFNMYDEDVLYAPEGFKFRM